jgi:hypothetical protein
VFGYARQEVVDALIAEVGELRRRLEALENPPVVQKAVTDEEQRKMPRTITSGKWPTIQRKLEIMDRLKVKPGT